MKSVLGVILLAIPLAAQTFSFGVKGGVPFTEAFHTASDNEIYYTTRLRPYTFGPSVELRLPHRLGVSLDALYKRVGYNGQFRFSSLQVRGNQFEFPVMAKYRFKDGPWSPYVAAGLSFNKISGVSRTVINPSELLQSDEFRDSVGGGYVLGGGLEFKPVVRITTELRWTRRTTRNFLSSANGLLLTNLNQAEFLVGIHF